MRDPIPEPTDLAVAISVAQKMLAAYSDTSNFGELGYAQAHGALSESLRILLHALGAEPGSREPSAADIEIGVRVSGVIGGQAFTGVVRSVGRTGGRSSIAADGTFTTVEVGALDHVSVETDNELTMPTGRKVRRAHLTGADALGSIRILSSAVDGTPPEQRCPAAHVDDPTPCGGPPVVTVLNATNAGADGCEHHAARLLASLDRGRVYALPDAPEGAAIRVHKAADTTRPFAWVDGPRTAPSQLSHAENRRRGEGK